MWGDSLKNQRAQRPRVHCGIMKKVIKIARRKEKQTANGPICIEQMTFQKTLGPNGTVITMVSGEAGRETNHSLSESPVQLFDNIAPHGRFWVQF